MEQLNKAVSKSIAAGLGTGKDFRMITEKDELFAFAKEVFGKDLDPATPKINVIAALLNKMKEDMRGDGDPVNG